MLSSTPSSTLKGALDCPLIFVGGKGGVGKTLVSRAIAHHLNHDRGKRVLWATVEDPIRPAHETRQIRTGLTTLNCDAFASFEEYAGLKLKKLGVPALTKLFVHNKAIKYLAKAAPGIRELVILGKLRHDIKDYDHVVVDLPSTGFQIAMFKSVQNFANVIRGGPVHEDATEMLRTFGDPTQSSFIIIALPEEMPLIEAVETEAKMKEIFPDYHAAFVLNRAYPCAEVDTEERSEGSSFADTRESPIPADLGDYVKSRCHQEQLNQAVWRDRGISYSTIEYFPPHLVPPVEFDEKLDPVMTRIAGRIARICATDGEATA